MNYNDWNNLKNQAKQLLLKGCYKMAANKYKKLLEKPNYCIDKRQWAVVHLNQAICYQMLGELQDAKQKAFISIQVDKTYEKAYYRLMQIYWKMGKFQQAMAVGPHWITNPQIIELKKNIQQEYMKSLGLLDLQTKITNSTIEEAKVHQMHHQLYQRITQINQPKQIIQNIARYIGTYYTFLRSQHIPKSYLKSWLKLIYRLYSFLSNQNKIFLWNSHLLNQQINTIECLKGFWVQYIKVISQILTRNEKINEYLSSQELNLIRHCPILNLNSQIYIDVLKNMLNSQLNAYLNLYKQKNTHKFQLQSCFQFIHTNSKFPINHQNCNKMYQLMKYYAFQLQKQYQGNLKQKQIDNIGSRISLIDSMIQIFFVDKQIKLNNINGIGDIFLLRYGFQHKKIMLDQSILRKILCSSFCFLPMYLFTDLNFPPGLKPIIQTLRKKISSNNSSYFKYTVMLIILKIDPKFPFIENDFDFQNLSQLPEISVNLLLILCVTHHQIQNKILQHPKVIIAILMKLIERPISEQMKKIPTIINFLYVTTVDLQKQQEQIQANKLGVSLAEVKAAKKIQGQFVQTNNQFRNSFRLYFMNETQLFCQLTHLCKLINEQSISINFAKVITVLCTSGKNKLIHSKIIEFMLNIYKLDKKTVGTYFIAITKSSNLQTFKYEHWQPIANCLLDQINNTDHQLAIFEGLLGLRNLCQQIKIPISKIWKLLYQQNQYIVHVVLQLINNIIVQGQQIQFRKQICELVEKYINHYRSQIKIPQQISQTDYSYPTKVYCTLISLNIVLEKNNIPELNDWQFAQNQLSILEDHTDIGCFSVTLFKLLMYHYKLNSNINTHCLQYYEKYIIYLKQIDQFKWQKIQFILRHTS